ncbi:oligosaccharide flippase family protein [Methanobacterium petrolearium]|uniref:oligosaccharide flippase family protein n=1 Tax=Methanobacterium petrolearium TaxID=710190 RepID=UPI001AE12F31|nr:oligosaccharide flippase family protein [Methanobacterium petrolearium]MBP1945444.1 O-antigen/teichoic acid export membrane protein [Methanobacterium petrolearium]BDZ71643.1 polysaccharide biosynthesis protein [Methanobacterium petrolearium]
MSEYKAFIQRIGLYGITTILGTLAAIILIPIITNNLTIEDYGAYIQVTVTIGLVSNLTTLGLPFSMVRFLSPLEDKDKISEGFYTILIIVALFSLLIAFIIFLFAGPLSTALFNGEIYVAQLLSAICFITCINTVLVGYFRTFNQMRRYSAFTLTQTILSMGLISYVAISGYGMYGVMISLVISYLTVSIISYILIVNEIGIFFPRFKNVKKYLSFGLPTVPGNLSKWIVDSSDRYIIGLLLGSAYVGYYSPGYTVGNIVLMLWNPFAFLLPSVLPRHHDKNDMDNVNFYLTNSIKVFLLLGIPCAFGLSILSKPILLLLTTPQIAMNGYLVTPFVALSALTLGFYGIFSNVFILKLKTKITGFIWAVGALMNLVLTIVLIPILGIIGAAIATLIAYSTVSGITIYYSKKYMKLEFDLGFMAKSILASIVMALFIFWMSPNGLLNILITIMISIIIYTILIFLFKGLTRKEVIFLKNMFFKADT